MRIFPAIDIRNGNCVRLVQGNYDRETIFGSNPVDMAQRWVSEGATGLHLVDLDGARDGTTANFDSIKQIAQSTKVPCQLGGGIRSQETIATYLEIGIERLVIGTKAVTDPDWFSEMTAAFPNKLLVGIDARNNKVATEGWEKTSTETPLDIASRVASLPIAGIIYTDISKDGMLAGPNLEAMKQMRDNVDVPVIASGGVTTLDDVGQLAAIGMDGCIIGLSLYEGKISLSEAIAVVEKQSSAS